MAEAQKLPSDDDDAPSRGSTDGTASLSSGFTGADGQCVNEPGLTSMRMDRSSSSSKQRNKGSGVANKSRKLDGRSPPTRNYDRRSPIGSMGGQRPRAFKSGQGTHRQNGHPDGHPVFNNRASVGAVSPSDGTPALTTTPVTPNMVTQTPSSPACSPKPLPSLKYQIPAI